MLMRSTRLRTRQTASSDNSSPLRLALGAPPAVMKINATLMVQFESVIAEMNSPNYLQRSTVINSAERRDHRRPYALGQCRNGRVVENKKFLCREVQVTVWNRAFFACKKSFRARFTTRAFSRAPSRYRASYRAMFHLSRRETESYTVCARAFPENFPRTRPVIADECKKPGQCVRE